MLEFVPGGDLWYRLLWNELFCERRARFYAAELTSAVEFLHKNGIVHRNIKLENILLDKDGHCKLADFGMSELGPPCVTKTTSLCRTARYMAPEELQGMKYGPEGDWWALGVVMYEMMVGQHPFESPRTSSFQEKILGNPVQYAVWLSKDAVSILEGLLTKDPGQRLGAHGTTDDKIAPIFCGHRLGRLLQKNVEPPVKPKVKEIDMDSSNYELIKEEAVPSWMKSALAHPINQDTYRDFTFVNHNYGLGQCQANRRLMSLHHFRPSFLPSFPSFVHSFLLHLFLPLLCLTLPLITSLTLSLLPTPALLLVA